MCDVHITSNEDDVEKSKSKYVYLIGDKKITQYVDGELKQTVTGNRPMAILFGLILNKHKLDKEFIKGLNIVNGWVQDREIVVDLGEEDSVEREYNIVRINYGHGRMSSMYRFRCLRTANFDDNKLGTVVFPRPSVAIIKKALKDFKCRSQILNGIQIDPYNEYAYLEYENRIYNPRNNTVSPEIGNLKEYDSMKCIVACVRLIGTARDVNNDSMIEMMHHLDDRTYMMKHNHHNIDDPDWERDEVPTFDDPYAMIECPNNVQIDIPNCRVFGFISAKQKLTIIRSNIRVCCWNYPVYISNNGTYNRKRTSINIIDNSHALVAIGKPKEFYHVSRNRRGVAKREWVFGFTTVKRPAYNGPKSNDDDDDGMWLRKLIATLSKIEYRFLDYLANHYNKIEPIGKIEYLNHHETPYPPLMQVKLFLQKGGIEHHVDEEPDIVESDLLEDDGDDDDDGEEIMIDVMSRIKLFL